MSSCCSFADSAKAHFTKKDAEKTLARYVRKGPDQTTRLLRDGLMAADLVHGTVLDVGAGIGLLSLELLEKGASRTTAVDASPAFIEVGKGEAARRGASDRLTFTAGDFIDAAAGLPPASVVVMDRVICCYPSHTELLRTSLEHAEHAFAWSYPRDRWFVRLAIGLENAVRRLRGSSFRAFVHPVREMHQLLNESQFALVSRQETKFWAVEVYRRQDRR